jgi:hypothetical protein
MDRRVVAAVDIGASSGRIIAGIVEKERVTLDPVHRFPNGIVERAGNLHWDFAALHQQVLTGLARLRAAHGQVQSIGIDTWGVDYGLLDGEGRLLDDPIAYRDDRTAKVIDSVHASVPPDELFAINGLQFLPFNTVYQLAAEQRGPRGPTLRGWCCFPTSSRISSPASCAPSPRTLRPRGCSTCVRASGRPRCSTASGSRRASCRRSSSPVRGAAPPPTARRSSRWRHTTPPRRGRGARDP